MEIWKDIKNYEGFYQVSNLGRIKRLNKWDVNKKCYVKEDRFIKPTDNGHGYKIVTLKKEGKRKNFYVHRLVAEYFIANPNRYSIVNHIDYDKNNNVYTNLEWCTQAQNVHHSVVNMRKPKKTKSKVTNEKGIYYRASKKHYRVVINKKEYPSQKTLEEAIQLRDKVLKEKGGD